MSNFIIVAHMPNGEIKEIESFDKWEQASKKLREYKDNCDDQRIWYVIRNTSIDFNQCKLI